MRPETQHPFSFPDYTHLRLDVENARKLSAFLIKKGWWFAHYRIRHSSDRILVVSSAVDLEKDLPRGRVNFSLYSGGA